MASSLKNKLASYILRYEVNRSVSNLQQASGSREAQRQGLAADVEGLGVGLLRADGKRVGGPGRDAPAGQPEQGVRAESHGRVRRVVEVENGQAKRRQADHERRLDGQDRQTDGGRTSWIF